MNAWTEQEFAAGAAIIFGGGGQGKTLIDLMRALDYPIAGIIDARLPAGSAVMGVPVLGSDTILPELHHHGVTLAVNAVGGIGNVDARIRIFDLLDKNGFTFPSLVHPSAIIEPSATLADGVHVLPLTYIGSDAQIGFGTLINAHVVVSHDCVTGRVVNLSPGALLAGGTRIEDYAQIGMGATININVVIGSRARVGNGATVKADLPPGGRVYAGTIWPPREGS
jgi:sugar O-acyltransferase (sialic acid O-acetyltransferase NeuD family)